MRSSFVKDCSFSFHYIPLCVTEREAEILSGQVASLSQRTHGIPSHWLPFALTEREIDNNMRWRDKRSMSLV